MRVALAVLSTVLFLGFSSRAPAQEAPTLSLGARAGYATRIGDFSDIASGPVYSLVGVYGASARVGVVGSVAFMESSEDVSLRCPLAGGPRCSLGREVEIGALAVGIRLSLTDPGVNRNSPYVEIVPTVFRSSWVHIDRGWYPEEDKITRNDGFLLGIQANVLVPVVVTRRGALEVGFGYVDSQGLKDDSIAGGLIRGFEHVQMLCGVGLNL